MLQIAYLSQLDKCATATYQRFYGRFEPMDVSPRRFFRLPIGVRVVPGFVYYFATSQTSPKSDRLYRRHDRSRANVEKGSVGTAVIHSICKSKTCALWTTGLAGRGQLCPRYRRVGLFKFPHSSTSSYTTRRGASFYDLSQSSPLAVARLSVARVRSLPTASVGGGELATDQ